MHVLASEDEKLVDLVDASVHFVVEDEEHQKLLHLRRRDVELLRGEMMMSVSG